jgi:FtsP/CotA-like multicopper oxidase with cupredoxin domain
LKHNATIWKIAEQDFSPTKAGSYQSWGLGLNQEVLLFPTANEGVQIVINSRDAMEHPWHLQ